MIRLTAAVFFALATFCIPAFAQVHVVIGTQRLTENGGLFMAAAKGYFKAEGIDLSMTAYDSDQTVAERLAGGITDFGLARFTPTAFNLSAKGEIKAIAAQAREKRLYEGADLVASNIGFAKGLRKFEDLAGKTIAIDALGSVSHYQLEQIARAKNIDIKLIEVKPMGTIADAARAVGTNQADAAIVPALYARELMMGNLVKLVGWYSELDEQQLGALFVSTKMINTRREVVEKFVRAYRRGVADYSAGLLRKDVHAKRLSDDKSHDAALTIARYVYPNRGGETATMVEVGAYFIEPNARLDGADIERQIAWYKARGLIDKDVTVQNVVDQNFIK